MGACLKHSFKRFITNEVSKIYLKKKNDFVKDLDYFAELNRQTFEKHFFSDPKTS